MKKILLISVLFMLVCNNVWAFASGSIPKPFCKAAEAAVKIENDFRNWFFNQGWPAEKEKEKVKACEAFVMKELIYTDYYTFDVSEKKNLLDDWSWVAVFINAQDLSCTVTVALKKDGTIKILGTTN